MSVLRRVAQGLLQMGDTVGEDVKQLGRALIKLTHVSGNACVSGCSNASGNAFISRHSMHTLTTDGPKKDVQLVVDVAVPAPPVELQQAPLIMMVSRQTWSPGVYRALSMGESVCMLSHF